MYPAIGNLREYLGVYNLITVSFTGQLAGLFNQRDSFGNVSNLDMMWIAASPLTLSGRTATHSGLFPHRFCQKVTVSGFFW